MSAHRRIPPSTEEKYKSHIGIDRVAGLAVVAVPLVLRLPLSSYRARPSEPRPLRRWETRHDFANNFVVFRIVQGDSLRVFIDETTKDQTGRKFIALIESLHVAYRLLRSLCSLPAAASSL
jgi:hypothetical protein